MNRAWAPLAAQGTGHAFLIQALCDLLRRETAIELSKDSFDDGRLFGLDFSLAPCKVAADQRPYDSIPIAEASARLAGYDSPAQAAASLVREVLQEQGIHRPLEPDVQVRDLTLGKGDDSNAEKREPLEETGSVFLVPAETVEGFSQDHVEFFLKSLPHQGLEAGAQEGSARNGMVVELTSNRPSFTFDKGAADP